MKKQISDAICHNKEAITQQLHENGGILGHSDIQVITNTEKFPQELQFLPDWLLLTDGTIALT